MPPRASSQPAVARQHRARHAAARARRPPPTARRSAPRIPGHRLAQCRAHRGARARRTDQRRPISATTSPSIPALGLAGGACEGYGLLLDISNPVNPVRIDAVADSNFSYWHSATFNNDGTKMLFSDEWGGGGAAEVPRDRQAGVGRQRHLHDREQAR